MKLSQVNYSDVDFNYLDGFDDRTVFQTKQWLDFLADAVHATPVIAELRGERPARLLHRGGRPEVRLPHPRCEPATSTRAAIVTTPPGEPGGFSHDLGADVTSPL